MFAGHDFVKTCTLLLAGALCGLFWREIIGGVFF